MLKSNLLKAYIKMYGYTIKEVALLTGIPLSSLHRNLSDFDNMRMGDFERICKAINLPYDEKIKFMA